MSIRVRAATPEDAAAIAEVQVETWRAAYAGLLPAEGLAALSVEQRAARWRENLAGPVRTLLALDRGRAVGFASVAACRDPDAGPWTGELWALYVRSELWGRGVGRALWAAAGASLAADGFREATLWVLADNARARGFYEGVGLRADGADKVVEILGVDKREVRHRGPLATEPFAAAFARALGGADAPRFLDPDVVFAGPGRPITGPGAALDAIADRAAAPPGALEEHTREVTLQPVGGDRFRVNIAERLRDGGHAHGFRHALVVTLPEGRGITRIVPVDLPGEQARLATFLRRIGLSR